MGASSRIKCLQRESTEEGRFGELIGVYGGRLGGCMSEIRLGLGDDEVKHVVAGNY